MRSLVVAALVIAALVSVFASAAPTAQDTAEVADVQCCWSKWGSTCGNYPATGKGGLCSTDWSKKCSSPGNCPTTTSTTASTSSPNTSASRKKQPGGAWVARELR